jgi:predicted phosphoribosyltransferase
MEASFPNREEAGRRLAESLREYADRPDAIVLALPRGGVPVAFEVARNLHLPLDVFIVRKLGVPGFEELALGAIASGGVRVLNEDVVGSLPDAARMVEEVTANELTELERREHSYRVGQPPLELRGRVAILVDDGIATGATMRAAVAALRQHGVARIVIAVPVGAADTCRALKKEETVCLLARNRFTRSASFTKSSGRLPTKRSVIYWTAAIIPRHNNRRVAGAVIW